MRCARAPPRRRMHRQPAHLNEALDDASVPARRRDVQQRERGAAAAAPAGLPQRKTGDADGVDEVSQLAQPPRAHHVCQHPCRVRGLLRRRRRRRRRCVSLRLAHCTHPAGLEVRAVAPERVRLEQAARRVRPAVAHAHEALRVAPEHRAPLALVQRVRVQEQRRVAGRRRRPTRRPPPLRPPPPAGGAWRAPPAATCRPTRASRHPAAARCLRAAAARPPTPQRRPPPAASGSPSPPPHPPPLTNPQQRQQHPARPPRPPPPPPPPSAGRASRWPSTAAGPAPPRRRCAAQGTAAAAPCTATSAQTASFRADGRLRSRRRRRRRRATPAPRQASRPS
eukprot:Rhum_TRINITY_DN14343_c8_g2::Rhum_TRINITY_DN14343_c8_g2_i1::g.83757::m.83757